MTDGQRLALGQLREIASQGGALQIVAVEEPSQPGGFLVVDVSIACAELELRSGGLPTRSRERLLLLIPADFPFEHPIVRTRHARFAGYPHVQWKRQLCLYQAPATEWDASDGMFGFIDRLWWWLKQAAVGELDPAGAPLHPPVAYVPAGPHRMVIPRSDTPVVGLSPWLGFAQLEVVAEHRVDIVGWNAVGSGTTGPNVATAILLSEPMPFEFPEKVSDLIAELGARGVPQHLLLLVLQVAAFRNPESDPLYVIIGTPMRGTSGGDRKQHLTAWCVDSVIVKGLRLAYERHNEHPEIAEIGRRAEGIVLDWAQAAQTTWCSVREARPEIVTRRDEHRPMAWFAGRVVSIWGCGAIGGHAAEMLVRAGARKLILRDRAQVAPGVLARQPYDDRDLGLAKVTALRERLLRIRPDLEIVVHNANILRDALDRGDWTDASDVLIDATVSEVVLAKLELRRREQPARRIPIISMALGHDASRALVVVAHASHSGGPADVVRRAKLEACSRTHVAHFANEFWPEQRHPIFQPEPGCSDPTFVGSAADVAALTGLMLNAAARSLQEPNGTSSAASFVAQASVSEPGSGSVASFFWNPDRVFVDPHSGYEIRVSAGAWADIGAWANRARRTLGSRVETGGLLFGERDDAAGVVWVSEVVGPPPDSEASETGFVCGVLGTEEANREKRTRTRRSVTYIGTWHTHPETAPIPSGTDIGAMRRLVVGANDAPSKLLLMIVGGFPVGSAVAAFVFDRKDFAVLRRKGELSRRYAVAHPKEVGSSRRIALALSGGGSRAIAFHLGCLRALHDRRLLDQIEVISAVSGGAVITGMYAYGKGSFEDFDAGVTELLERGLAAPIARHLLLSPRLLGALLTVLGPGIAALSATAARALLRAASRRGDSRGVLARSERIQAPLRRWTSRTHAFEAALQDGLFGDTTLADARRDQVHVVLNACELRTGTAFRFGSRESACWRFGRVRDNAIPLSFAVAASAAYPALLPAIDRMMTFVRNGEERRERVIITDGGVYDNLGLSCLAPGRSAEVSSNVFSPEYIICCDAGAGQLSDHIVPFWWPSRMSRSFATTFRRSVDCGYRELHEWARSGAIRGFVLSYLGQQDRSLPCLPADLVRRDEVAHYPTDFSPMRPADVERLAARGEQLTRLLVSHYLPEI